MLKKILLIALFVIPVSLSAQTMPLPAQQAPNSVQPKFGYLSYTEIFKAMPEYADAQESLNILRSKYEAEIKRADEEFNKKYAEFLQDQKNFPETILMRRQKELQQLMEKSIEFKDEIKQLLKEAQEKMTEPVTTKLNTVLSTIGTQHGFEYILNTDRNTYPYINTLYGMDITQEVKSKLGIKENTANE